jgi:hypothetical protein
MKKLVTTPLTNTIWWATVNEDKGMITGNRVDVTDDAINAVFQHLINMDNFKEKGFAGYEIPRKEDDSFITICVFDSRRHICISKKLFEELKNYEK